LREATDATGAIDADRVQRERVIAVLILNIRERLS